LTRIIRCLREFLSWDELYNGGGVDALLRLSGVGLQRRAGQSAVVSGQRDIARASQALIEGKQGVIEAFGLLAAFGEAEREGVQILAFGSGGIVLGEQS